MALLIAAGIVAVGINLVMFVPAYLLRTDKLTDISYALTFVVVSIAGLLASRQRPLHWLVVALVLVWAARLGVFLLVRITKRGKDRRFDGMRDKPAAFLGFWSLQGLTVFVVLLAPLLALAQQDARLSAFNWLGVAIYAAGLATEAVADAQKFRFGNDPANKGHWIDEGVWRTSRHPNYVGEMLVWIGVYLTVVTALRGVAIVVGLISPLYIITLLRFVSGVPGLERSAADKWGGQAAYDRYRAEVPLLIPTPSSIKRLAAGKPKS